MVVIGGQVLAAMLASEGVDTVFGIPDGTYMGLFGSFERYGIRLVTPRHETTAAHMAAAYARLTGKLGVCMASNGPGVANILPGIAVEHTEGNRVLLLTSCRRQGIAYPNRGGGYQIFDQVGTIRGMSKWSEVVHTADRLPELMRKALRASFTGRPGVVHLDVPENLLNGRIELTTDLAPPPESYRRTHPLTAPDDLVDKVAGLLARSERPLIHAGSGVIHAGAFEELEELARALDAPVSTSWAAGSALRCNHARRLPIWALGANDQARTSADLVLVLGSRLGETDWWGKAPYWNQELTVIQVDLDEDSLGLNRPVDLGILADARGFVRALLPKLADRAAGESTIAARRRFLDALATTRERERRELDERLGSESAQLTSPQVPVICRELLDDDAIAVIDGGNTAVWASFFYHSRRPNTVLSTFKMGMLGAGQGQALGAAVALPERQVCCITGDGAFGFHPQELETAVRHQLPVVFVVCVDEQWGMVKLTQTFGLAGIREVIGSDETQPVNADFAPIAYDRLAESMGARGYRARTGEELRTALESALRCGGPALVHCEVDRYRHLMPPGLQEFKNMHQEPGGES